MDYLLLLSSIFAGALSVLLFKLYQPAHIKLLNAFTGAYLLCLTILHLLPELYQSSAVPVNAIRIGSFILLGFFIQLALDVISMGVEHGHSHSVHGHAVTGVLVGLCIHALLEAMALGRPDTHFDPSSRTLLLYSIVLHNYPVSIALLGMLLHSGMKRRSALSCLGIFAAMAPLGMTLGGQTIISHYGREMMAVVIGIFMHISTTILFESSDIHKFHVRKLAAIIAGAALGILSVLLH
jgi:zinc transporter ZupT